jgi:hypothetical protein
MITEGAIWRNGFQLTNPVHKFPFHAQDFTPKGFRKGPAANAGFCKGVKKNSFQELETENSFKPALGRTDIETHLLIKLLFGYTYGYNDHGWCSFVSLRPTMM